MAALRARRRLIGFWDATIIRQAALAASLTALAACVGDCAPLEPLPANYRQIFAQYVAADARAKPDLVIHDAFISKPFEKACSLLHGCIVTAVCVQVMVENKLLFDHVSPSNFFLTVKYGKVDDLAAGTDQCSDLSPFPELMQLIRR
jgi:hypothetical protein